MWKKPHYKKTGGMDAVSSDMGLDICYKTFLHDDGVKGYGGMRIACIAPMRWGKTTLALTNLLKMYFVGSMPKEKYLADRNRDRSQMVKETIIYRGRKLDYWNCMTKKHFRSCFPKAEERDLRVFVFKDDEITFYEESQDDDSMKKLSGLDIYKYTDQKDLYNNLIEGGINVVYVPNDYKLSTLLKNTLNEMRMLTPQDSEWLDPMDIVSVINETFWYDLFYYMQEIENSRDKETDEGKGIRRLKSVVFFFDEAHQIFPANEPKPFWYLIDDFAENALIDSGRMNMTIYANIHALNLMYWKVLQRFDTFIWLGGSKPDKNYSMVNDKLTRRMQKGTFIIEEKQKQFGKSHFDRIPNQPYTVLAKGAA